MICVTARDLEKILKDMKEVGVDKARLDFDYDKYRYGVKEVDTVYFNIHDKDGRLAKYSVEVSFEEAY